MLNMLTQTLILQRYISIMQRNGVNLNLILVLINIMEIKSKNLPISRAKWREF